jgi:hypothetical protein
MGFTRQTRSFGPRPGLLERYFLAFAIILTGSSIAGAQSPPTPDPTPNAPRPQTTDQKGSTAADNTQPTDKAADTDDTPKDKKKTKRGEWIIAPIPINSPAFGAGVILGLGYVFPFRQSDKVSPPSTLALATVFTNNGTRGAAIGGKLYFAENKYQTTFVIAKGRANYEFFGIGREPDADSKSVLIKQNGTVLFGEFLRNVWRKVFIGPRVQYRKLTATTDEIGTPGGFVIPPIDFRSTTASIGFHIQRDLRDHSFYPRSGSLWDFKADFFSKAIGSNRTYQSYQASYNGYYSLGEKDVLAYRAMACSVSDSAPFYDLCFFGSRADLRGYTSGEFQDRRMFATQAEYRRELKWRLGLVAFAGIGGVAPRWSDLETLLPAAGAGIRFKLDKTNNINYRVDLGFGRTGYTVSVSVTEAF